MGDKWFKYNSRINLFKPYEDFYEILIIKNFILLIISKYLEFLNLKLKSKDIFLNGKTSLQRMLLEL